MSKILDPPTTVTSFKDDPKGRWSESYRKKEIMRKRKTCREKNRQKEKEREKREGR
jgi:hypothetical protein